AMPLVEDVGQVAEVELRVGRGSKVEDLLLASVGRLGGGAACGIAVDEALGAVGLKARFEASGLAWRQAAGHRGLGGGQAPLEEGVADFMALDLRQGELRLRAVHGWPPCE